jgi:hypothetical protein
MEKSITAMYWSRWKSSLKTPLLNDIEGGKKVIPPTVWRIHWI